MDAFDADVLIYAADRQNALGRRVRELFAESPSGRSARIGSVVLVPELLSRPYRENDDQQIAALSQLVNRLELRPADRPVADLAAQLGAQYRLRAADAIHLATAVLAGADRFITNNRRDFPKSIAEIDILYPDDLPVPTE